MTVMQDLVHVLEYLWKADHALRNTSTRILIHGFWTRRRRYKRVARLGDRVCGDIRCSLPFGTVDTVRVARGSTSCPAGRWHPVACLKYRCFPKIGGWRRGVCGL